MTPGFVVYRHTAVAISISNEDDTSRGNLGRGRFAKLSRARPGLELLTKNKTWLRCSSREFHHLMKTDIGDPYVALLIDVEAMRHVEHVLSKAGDHFSFVCIQRQDCVNLNRFLFSCNKSIL